MSINENDLNKEKFLGKKRLNLDDFNNNFGNFANSKIKFNVKNEDDEINKINNLYKKHILENQSNITSLISEPKINFLNGKEYSQKYFAILEKRKSLPAFEAKETLKKLLEENQVVILQGETGSGKTTQVPQFIIDYGY